MLNRIDDRDALLENLFKKEIKWDLKSQEYEGEEERTNIIFNLLTCINIQLIGCHYIRELKCTPFLCPC